MLQFPAHEYRRLARLKGSNFRLMAPLNPSPTSHGLDEGVDSSLYLMIVKSATQKPVLYATVHRTQEKFVDLIITWENIRHKVEKQNEFLEVFWMDLRRFV